MKATPFSSFLCFAASLFSPCWSLLYIYTVCRCCTQTYTEENVFHLAYMLASLNTDRQLFFGEQTLANEAYSNKIQAQIKSTYCTTGTSETPIKWLYHIDMLWVIVQQYTRPPWTWRVDHFVILFFIIIAISLILVQLLHNDSHSRYFVTQEQLKGIKTKETYTVRYQIIWSMS